MSKLKLGLFGFGCVGSGLYEVLSQSQFTGAELIKIVVKNKDKQRKPILVPFSYNPNEILEDDEINVVIELINDSSEAYRIIKAALIRKKHVVTANKKVLSEHLDELIQLAQQNGVSLLYEAAVAGSIPIIRNLEEYYNNDSLTSIDGILNGTTNYILSQVNDGKDYQTALKLAQDEGFAESNPTLDIHGFDAAYKLTLLIKHAFGLTIQINQVLTVGIQKINKEDLNYSNEKKYKVKLVARAFKDNGKLFAFVAPHFTSSNQNLFNVENEFNAISVQASFADKQLFYGKGAGSLPTASAVLSDVSSLLYDYKYEYKKTNDSNLVFSDDRFVKIYLGSEDVNNLSKIRFYNSDEFYVSKNYSFRIGIVRLTDLIKIDWNKQNDVSLILFSDLFDENLDSKQLTNFEFLNRNSNYSIH